MPTVSSMDEELTRRSQSHGPRLIIALTCAEPIPERGVDGWMSSAINLQDVYEVQFGRGDSALSFERVGRGDAALDILIPDRRMSGKHLHLVRELNRWHLRDANSKNGTWLNGERVSEATLEDNDVIELGATVLLFRSACQLPPGVSSADLQAQSGEPMSELCTLNPHLALTFSTLRRLAPSELSILLHGETGTGKEVVARAIHQRSGRKGAFVAVNCSAFPETLIASELFGVERGAFSGAHKSRPGLMRSADGGTLFLDEIAELPLACQAVLLRALQDGKVTPVGGTGQIDVDMRVLAATHQDLQARVESDGFRRDLLARLRGFTLELPPLCERREDIGLLISRLLPIVAGDRAGAISFSRRAGGQMFIYHWPDNVRELEKTLHSAVLRADDGKIRLEHLPDAVANAKPILAAPPKPSAPNMQVAAVVPADGIVRIHPRDPDAAEKFLALFIRCNGNVSAMARALETSRAQVRRLIKRYGIDDERE